MIRLRFPSAPVACVALLLAARPAFGETHAPATGLLDLAGHAANPFATHAARLLVFVFVRTDCPIANAYAPEVQRLSASYAARGVVWRLVYCDPDESPARIRRHLADFACTSPALRDPAQRFAKRSRVRVTPEAAVWRPDGVLLYHGRIDDRYADFGKARPEPVQRDLVRALDAALAGRRVPAASGPAVGCGIAGL